MPTQQVVDKYTNETTLAVVPKITKASSKRARYMWLFFCTFASICLLISLYFIVAKYLAFPKNTLVHMSRESAPFPAITVCRTQNIKPYTLNTLHDIFSKEKEPVNNLNKTENEFINEYMMFLAKFKTLYNDISLRNKFPLFFNEMMSRRSLASNIKKDLLQLDKEILLEELLVGCSFRTEKCEKKRFRSFSDAHYLHCLSYNNDNYKDMESESKLNASNEGIENGWSAIFYAGNGIVAKGDNTEIIPGLIQPDSKSSANEGLRVIIHAPNTYPDPSMEGFDVPTGFSASLGIRPKRFHRLKEPYGKCVSDFSSFNITGIRWDYRLTNCYSLTLQKLIQSECHCRDTSLISADRSLRPCRLIQHFPEECMYNVTDNCIQNMTEVNENLKCINKMRDRLAKDASLFTEYNCYDPCNELVYDISYSLSKWPATGLEGNIAYIDIFHKDRFIDGFKNPKEQKMMKEYFVNYKSANRTQDDILGDFSRINVYIEHSHVYISSEEEAYSFVQMWSDIGGQLSLWMGISAVTAIELLDFFSDLVHSCIKDKVKKRRKKKGKSDKHNDILMHDGN